MNDLECDCELLWLWEFFKNQTKRLKLTYDPLNGNCARPLRLYNRNLKNLTKTDFECSKYFFKPSLF